MKNRRLFFIGFSFLLFCTNLSLAQEESDMNKFGVSAALFTSKQIFENKRLAEGELLFGYQIELNYLIRISNKIRFKTGISYHLIRINELDYSPIFQCDINGSTGIDTRNSWLEHQDAIHYIGIPFEFNYSVFSNLNDGLYVKAGFEPLLKVGETAKNILHECGTNQTEFDEIRKRELKKSIVMVNFGVGYLIKIFEHSHIYFEPEIAYSFSKIFKDGTSVNNSNVLQRKLTVGLTF